MFKKNKILAGSLAAVGAGGLVTSFGNNTVKADILNLFSSFWIFRLLSCYFGKNSRSLEEYESSELFKNSRSLEEYESSELFKNSHSLEEYKSSKLFLDYDMRLNIDSPNREGDTIEIEDNVLVATRIGDKKHNFLVWRVKDSEKTGKPIYIFDTETYAKNVAREALENRHLPSPADYIYNHYRKNYDKESHINMLKERAKGVYKAFNLGRKFKVFKLIEKDKESHNEGSYSLEEYKSSELVFDYFWDLNLYSPSYEGETVKAEKDVLVATEVGDKELNFLVWRVVGSEKSGKPIYVFDYETYAKNIFVPIHRAEKEAEIEKKSIQLPDFVEYIYNVGRENYKKKSQTNSMLQERASGIYDAFTYGKKFKFSKLVERKSDSYHQTFEMPKNFGILTES